MGGRGRGWGRGRGMTFDVSALGVSAGDPLPAPILQPPPTYPPLERQPAPMQMTPETEYMIALKKEFVVFYNNYLCSPEKGGASKENALSLDWRFLPAELAPKKTTVKKRSGSAVGKPKKKANIDLSFFDELEKNETNVDEPEVKQEEETEEKAEGEEEQNEADEEDEEDLDEEMDDGTDYVNNYFDNGEGFDDDDDNGNDGPIY